MAAAIHTYPKIKKKKKKKELFPFKKRTTQSFCPGDRRKKTQAHVAMFSSQQRQHMVFLILRLEPPFLPLVNIADSSAPRGWLGWKATTVLGSLKDSPWARGFGKPGKNSGETGCQVGPTDLGSVI